MHVDLTSVGFSSDRQMEIHEAIATLKEKYERDRKLLSEENQKLILETDRVSEAGDNERFGS